jgi:hypothetical protein
MGEWTGVGVSDTGGGRAGSGTSLGAHRVIPEPFTILSRSRGSIMGHRRPCGPDAPSRRQSARLLRDAEMLCGAPAVCRCQVNAGSNVATALKGQGSTNSQVSRNVLRVRGSHPLPLLLVCARIATPRSLLVEDRPPGPAATLGGQKARPLRAHPALAACAPPDDADTDVRIPALFDDPARRLTTR